LAVFFTDICQMSEPADESADPPDLSFLRQTEERPALNQYWYSSRTITAIARELEDVGGSVAFLSTPSIYFSLPDESQVRAQSVVFDFDRQWDTHPNFRFFDFHQPGAIDSALWRSFDWVVVDPPFITRDVWELYADAVKFCLKPGGRVMCTTVPENEAVLRDLFGQEVGALRKARFMPAMQNAKLPYQYALFLNYEPSSNSALAAWNGEVPRDFEASNSSTMETAVVVVERPTTGSGLSFEELLARELARDANA